MRYGAGELPGRFTVVALPDFFPSELVKYKSFENLFCKIKELKARIPSEMRNSTQELRNIGWRI